MCHYGKLLCTDSITADSNACSLMSCISMQIIGDQLPEAAAKILLTKGTCRLSSNSSLCTCTTIVFASAVGVPIFRVEKH